MQKSIGASLLISAALLFAVALLLLFTTASPYAILFAVLSLATGLTGFKQLETIEPPPTTTSAFEIDLLGAVLKTGIDLHVTIELTFTPVPLNPDPILFRIKARLLRTLNIYASRITNLPDDPFAEIEHIFENTADPLCDELRLHTIAVKVIDVKLQGAPQSSNRGIHFGD